MTLMTDNTPSAPAATKPPAAPKAPKRPKVKTVKTRTPGLDAGLRPGAPYSKSDINLILGLLRPTPASAYAGQVRDDVTAATSPIIKQIRDSIAGETKLGQQAIEGYSDAYAKRVAPLAGEAKATYDTAKNEQGATGAAIGKYLEGSGAAAGDELMTKLKQMNAGPAADQLAAADTTGTANLAGGATFASGASVLDRLIEQGANAETSAKKLPGIGALAGLQSGKEFQLQQDQNLSDRIGDVTSQIPAMVNQALKDLVSADGARRSTAASLIQDLIKNGYGNELQKAIARQGYNKDVVDAINQGAQFNAGEVNNITQSLIGATNSGSSADTINANEHQNAVTQAGADAYQAAQALIQPQPVQVGTRPDGTPIYRSKSGGRTFDASQAATTNQAPKYSDAYKAVFNRILPELQALDPAGARRLADQITRAQLAAAGIQPPAKKG